MYNFTCVLTIIIFITYTGTGLFTSKELKTGFLVCYYFGKLLSGPIPKTYDTTYVFLDADASFFKSGGDGKNIWLAQFINDPRCDTCCNVKIKGTDSIVYSVDNVQYIKYPVTALRTIAAGEELFLDYGNGFWRDPSRSNLLTTDMQHGLCSFDRRCDDFFQ